MFRALNPDQVNALSGQLIEALQGEGATISSFFAQTAALTNTLADRDQLIGSGHLQPRTPCWVPSVTERSQFAKTVDSLSDLMGTLADRKKDLSNGIAYANEAAVSIADLLAQARPPLLKIVHEADRTASSALADRDYLDNLLNTLARRLPDAEPPGPLR